MLFRVSSATKDANTLRAKSFYHSSSLAVAGLRLESRSELLLGPGVTAPLKDNSKTTRPARSSSPGSEQMEPKVIEYPIPLGNDKGGILHIFGEKISQKCVLYLGGFPDGVEPFTPMAKRLASNGCYFGVTCFPGYDFGRYNEPGSNYHRDGYRFKEVASAVREAASQLLGEYSKTDDGKHSECKNPDYTLILHDWGTVAGAVYANQVIADKELSISKGSLFTELAPNRIVFLDVLPGPARNMRDCTKHISPYTRREMICFLAYQGTFAWSFWWHRMSKMAGIMQYGIFAKLVKLAGLSPTRAIDNRMFFARITTKDRLSHMIYMMYREYLRYVCLQALLH